MSCGDVQPPTGATCGCDSAGACVSSPGGTGAAISGYSFKTISGLASGVAQMFPVNV